MRNLPWSIVNTLMILVAGSACGGGEQAHVNDMEPGSLREAKQAIEYNGHDYLFVMTSLSWDQAQAYCRDEGYDLVTINDVNEENWLDSQENSRAGGAWWWIGYNDRGFEGSWTWIGGTSSFTNWTPGEPNNQGDADCAADNWSYGRWDDHKCSSGHYFICESSALANKGSFSYSAFDTASATRNTVDHAVQLYQGMVFTLGTCGVPGSSGRGDTYLRLNAPWGAEVASNDDACGYLSNLSYVVPATGTYVIQAGCYGTTSCDGTVSYNY